MNEVVTSYGIMENELEDLNGRIIAFPDYDSFEEIWVDAEQFAEPSTDDLMDWDDDLFDDLKDPHPEIVRESWI